MRRGGQDPDGLDLQDAQQPRAQRRRPSWRRRAAVMVTGLVVAAGVQVAAAPPSSANATGYEMMRRDLALRAGYHAVVTTCPAGKVVTGGGAHIRDANSGDDVIIQETGPVGTTSWTVAFTLKSPDMRIISISTGCMTPPERYQIVRASWAIPAGQAWTKSVSCPGGSAAIGGGARAADYSGLDVRTVIQGSRTDVWTWISDVRNNDSTAHVFSLFAVCAAVPNINFVMTTAQLPPWSLWFGPTRATAAARCPAGKLPLSGGATVDGGAGHHVDMQLNGLMTAPDVWYTTFIHWDLFITRTITSTAACA